MKSISSKKRINHDVDWSINMQKLTKSKKSIDWVILHGLRRLTQSIHFAVVLSPVLINMAHMFLNYKEWSNYPALRTPLIKVDL